MSHTATVAAPLLTTQALSVAYRTPAGPLTVVREVDLTIRRGEFLGIVGESGSGKSQLLLALLGLSSPGALLSGSIRYGSSELIGAGTAVLNRIRGDRVSMVFQDPMTALNPYLTVGLQIGEVLELHRGLDRGAARRRAAELLDAVQISEARRRLTQYPHELSGGMRQRVMIAMALACEPEILLADEPTTALDVTVQAQILTLLRELRARTGTAVVLVTHDLGVVAELADRIAVMYAGRFVEEAPADVLFSASRHPYTGALKRSIPRIDAPLPERMPSIPGNPPNPAELPPGCAFAPRCALRIARCVAEVPPLRVVGPTHRVACCRDDVAADGGDGA
ncbi:MAG: ABC transporter ATP-binding protein [Gammaproteobacteria bacterium]|nr:ABC transporter ATP-binding protein [Gammaproteobacteria bacterium]